MTNRPQPADPGIDISVGTPPYSSIRFTIPKGKSWTIGVDNWRRRRLFNWNRCRPCRECSETLWSEADAILHALDTGHAVERRSYLGCSITGHVLHKLLGTRLACEYVRGRTPAGSYGVKVGP